jgi:formylglycine-generating enzyme required for sulfatase activity
MPLRLTSRSTVPSPVVGSTPADHEKVTIRTQDGTKTTTVRDVLDWKSDFFDGLLNSLGRTSSGKLETLELNVPANIFNEAAVLMQTKSYGKIPSNWQNTARQELVEEQLSFFSPRPYTAAIIASERAKVAAEAAAKLIPAGFVRIEAGSFEMGSPEGEAGRDPVETQHRVSLSRPFLLQSTSVTQGQWQCLMGNNPSEFQSGPEAVSRPVEQVSWYDAVA